MSIIASYVLGRHGNRDFFSCGTQYCIIFITIGSSQESEGISILWRNDFDKKPTSCRRLKLQLHLTQFIVLNSCSIIQSWHFRPLSHFISALSSPRSIGHGCCCLHRDTSWPRHRHDNSRSETLSAVLEEIFLQRKGGECSHIRNCKTCIRCRGKQAGQQMM